MTVDPGYFDLVVAVPEPSTLALLGIGVIALAARFWRRLAFASKNSIAPVWH